jgi:hypothetical protein
METTEETKVPANEDLKKALALAAIAFDAYNKQAGGKTWDGKDIPPFSEVGEKVQLNWCAAALAISEEVTPKEDGVIHIVTEEDVELCKEGITPGEAIFVPEAAILRKGDEGWDEAVASYEEEQKKAE